MMKELLNKLIPNYISDQLADSPNRQKIAANAAWLFGGRILRMVIGLAVGVWMARYLGPDRFGIYNYAIALVALFGPLASLGMERIVVRDLVNSPHRTGEILGSAFLLHLLAGVGGFLLVLPVIHLVRPSDPVARFLVWIVAASLVFKGFEVVDLWFQSQIDSRYVVMARTSAFLATSVGRVALILAGAPLLAFGWIYSAEYLLMALGMLLIYRLGRGAFASWKWDWETARTLLVDSFPLLLSSIMIIIYMRIDQVMLGHMLGNREVGIYSTAVRLTEVWYFIPTAIVASAFPIILESRTGEPGAYLVRLQSLYNVLIWMAILIAIPMTLFSNPLVELLFGREYIEAGPVLSISIWAGVFVFFGVARSSWLVAEGFQRYSNYYILAGAVANVVLNYLLIPIMGGRGAAIATLAAQFTAAYLVPLFLKDVRLSCVMFNRALLPFLFRGKT